MIPLCAAETPSVGIQFHAIDGFQQGIFARCNFIEVFLQRVNLFVRRFHLGFGLAAARGRHDAVGAGRCRGGPPLRRLLGGRRRSCRSGWLLLLSSTSLVIRTLRGGEGL